MAESKSLKLHPVRVWEIPATGLFTKNGIINDWIKSDDDTAVWVREYYNPLIGIKVSCSNRYLTTGRFSLIAYFSGVNATMAQLKFTGTQ